jgi:5'(3')-deoxyribonucleotidase
MTHADKIIAIDLDDTLSYTNLAICKWHNEKYGTNMTLDGFYSYYYWQNPGWGTAPEAMSKVTEFLTSPYVNEILPIEDAQRGTKRLKDAGYKLVVITARMDSIAEDSVAWVEKHFPGIFDTVYFTSAFQNLGKAEHLVTEVSGPPAHRHTSTHPTDPRGMHLPAYSVPRKKSDVCLYIGAIALVDDAIENAFEVRENAGIVECLLYGKWRWNRTLHKMDGEENQLSYEQAKARGIDIEKEKPTPLPDRIERTETWTEVVQHIQRLALN